MVFVVVDDDEIADGWVEAAPAVPRSQGLGGEEAILIETWKLDATVSETRKNYVMLRATCVTGQWHRPEDICWSPGFPDKWALLSLVITRLAKFN